MNFKILTVPHTLFAAKGMVIQLRKLGHNAQIVQRAKPGDHDVYIIYQANHVAMRDMPANYILQQTEIYHSHWFGRSEYRQKIRNAIAIWDYSTKNIDSYSELNDSICIVEPGIFPYHPGLGIQNSRTIPWLFYGWIEGSDRRRLMIDRIKKAIPLEVITNTLEDAMWYTLSRTRVVINIHYHQEGDPLELYRICEAQSMGCRVLTEDWKYYPSKERITIAGFDFFEMSMGDNLEQIKNGLKIAGL